MVICPYCGAPMTFSTSKGPQQGKMICKNKEKHPNGKVYIPGVVG